MDHIVRVDRDLYDHIKGKRTFPSESVNQVLRRLLGLEEGTERKIAFPHERHRARIDDDPGKDPRNVDLSRHQRRGQ